MYILLAIVAKLCRTLEFISISILFRNVKKFTIQTDKEKNKEKEIIKRIIHVMIGKSNSVRASSNFVWQRRFN